MHDREFIKEIQDRIDSTTELISEAEEEKDRLWKLREKQSDRSTNLKTRLTYLNKLLVEIKRPV